VDFRFDANQWVENAFLQSGDQCRGMHGQRRTLTGQHRLGERSDTAPMSQDSDVANSDFADTGCGAFHAKRWCWDKVTSPFFTRPKIILFGQPASVAGTVLAMHASVSWLYWTFV